MILHHILTNFYSLIERKANDTYYMYKLSFVLVALTCFFSAPRVFFFFLQDSLPTWDVIILKSADLTHNLGHIDPGSWQSKKVFRLTIPLLMKLFNLSPRAVIITQIMISYLTFLFTYKLTFRICKDTVLATLLTTGIAFLYLGKASLFEYQHTWFDGFSYFFLLASLYSRSTLSIFLFSTLAAWNDERAFIALSFVFLFHYFEDKNDKRIVLDNLFQFNRKSIVVIIAIVSYILLRLAASYWYDIHTPKDGANLNVLVYKTYRFIPVGITSFFEGFYVLLVLFFLFVLMSKDYWRLLLVGIPTLVIILVSFSVTDITRSGTFAFPIIFISIHYLKDKLTRIETRFIFLIGLFISFLIPPFFICADWDINGMLTRSSLIFALELIRDFIK